MLLHTDGCIPDELVVYAIPAFPVEVVHSPEDIAGSALETASRSQVKVPVDGSTNPWVLHNWLVELDKLSTSAA